MPRLKGNRKADPELAAGVTISCMSNANRKFFSRVIMIQTDENQYRVVGVYKDKIIYDETHRTVRGSKIALEKKFETRIEIPDFLNKSEWTDFYSPEKQWILKNFPWLLEDQEMAA